MPPDPTYFVKIASCAFFAILFLQSGIDKVLDYKGNLSYFQDHFSKSPLKSFVGAMMPAITLLELASGVLSGAGAFLIPKHGEPFVAIYGIELCCLSLLCLFLGQRVAKDYAGASTLAIYMGVALITLMLLGG